MKVSHPAWQRLVTSARSASDDRDTSAPYGFAVRVAALAMAAERPVVSLFERMSLRAMGVACLLAVLAVAANYSHVRRLFDDETMATASDDPIAQVVDLASS